MAYPPVSTPPTSKKRVYPRFFGWWFALPANKQDRIITFTPLACLLVFIVFVLLSYIYLTNEQEKRDRINALQAMSTIEQQMRLLFISNEEALNNLAIEVMLSSDLDNAFHTQAKIFLKDHPEIVALYWHNIENNHIYIQLDTNTPNAPATDIPIDDIKTLQVLNASTATTDYGPSPARSTFFYQPPFSVESGTSFMFVSIALPSKENAHYVLTVAYDLNRLLRKLLPSEIALHTSLWLKNEYDQTLASTDLRPSVQADMPITVRSNIEKMGDNITLHVQSAQQKTFTSTFLFSLTASLCFFISALLLLNWRHIRQLAEAQNAAQRESNYRKAIENSVTTGLQAFDLQGSIVYVNPAFCQIVGYKEEELIGATLPYPYWPDFLCQELLEKMQNILISCNTQPTAQETQLRRRNGELFYAEIYIAPLIDETGLQTGWIAAVTDVSESKRSREELAMAGQRFTTVLEGMDAAISVSAVGARDLLFTNNAYRHLFGNSEDGHAFLAAKTRLFNPVMSSFSQHINNGNSSDESELQEKEHLDEVYLKEHEKWVEVRSQFLPWVDGRLAQMLITTDITERKIAREQAAIQAEQAEAASRLITIGEMASSVAHELNQPLTAINNYCSGLISRIQNNALSGEELVQTLEKTARQARRAGNITQRIRSFVKKNTPKRVLASIDEIMEVVRELAEIDTARKHITLVIDVEHNLPAITADPVLIEQVLLNLTRNAVEAIDEAKRPDNQRLIKIQVKRITNAQDVERIEFSVSDSGTGMPTEVIEHLFEAFFTTKPSGLGIGLNLCRSIIESHGGQLTFHNIIQGDTPVGCCFAFTLPIRAQDEVVNSSVY